MLYFKIISSNFFRKMNIYVYKSFLYLKKFLDFCIEEGQDKFIVLWNREFRNDVNSIYSEERKLLYYFRFYVLLYKERYGYVDRVDLWILFIGNLFLFFVILNDNKIIFFFVLFRNIFMIK